MIDVIVIGGGHAGIEAALACARMKKETVLYTLHIEYDRNDALQSERRRSGKRNRCAGNRCVGRRNGKSGRCNCIAV